MKKWVLPAVCVLSVFCFSSTSLALVFYPETANINFRFNNPGARANAMGGAFIGLADDATAAFTNPAGLVVLTKPKLAAEHKYTEFSYVSYDFTGAKSDTKNIPSDKFCGDCGQNLTQPSLAIPKDLFFDNGKHQFHVRILLFIFSHQQEVKTCRSQVN